MWHLHLVGRLTRTERQKNSFLRGENSRNVHSKNWCTKKNELQGQTGLKRVQLRLIGAHSKWPGSLRLNFFRSKDELDCCCSLRLKMAHCGSIELIKNCRYSLWLKLFSKQIWVLQNFWGSL